MSSRQYGNDAALDVILSSKGATVLDLADHGLTELPAEIGLLTWLEELHIATNYLTSLPKEIGRLSNLRGIYAGGNRLMEVPAEIGQLKKLERLTLARNQLLSLPQSIGEMRSLRELNLAENALTHVPVEIGHLLELRRLDLAHNAISELPDSIGGLGNLIGLSLASNMLERLPETVGNLVNLRSLNLEDNQLTSLPDTIGALTNLAELALRKNDIEHLPRGLAYLLGAGLIPDLYGNPLQDPIPLLLELGWTELAQYLLSLGDAVPQYEAKLMLVGEGNVGKSCLLDALAGLPFVEDRPTTHGIEVHTLTLPHPEVQAAMAVRAWDFGGQEVYRITHQFFYTDRTVYLVVWNPREGGEQNDVQGWLRRLRIRVGSDARVLIVATHCDERRSELDYSGLGRQFGEMLAGQFEVDSRSGTGMSGLISAASEEVSRLPQMGQMLSPRWVSARDEILELAKTMPSISYEDFERRCTRHYMTREEVATLVEVMNVLGQVIYYSDDNWLSDTVVLNPEWLTKAVGYVLEHSPTRQAGGVLDHTDLRTIWGNSTGHGGYALRYHTFFLRLMEKFEISFRLPDETRSLVAQLVPHERPSLPWDFGSPLPDGMRALTLVCRLRDVAPGLVSWLTVRHHRSTTGAHWRTGVFLRHTISSHVSEALVELQEPTKLVIEVRSTSPDTFFSVIFDSAEDIFRKRWRGLDYRW